MSALLDELKENPIVNIDYVGFTYNGVHSSQLKILSVSDGSRYHMDLLPTTEDYSVDIVGGYGANYFGGFFKKREITLNIAYDEVEEQHLMAMRELFGDREVHELYFDENPYKVYRAVVTKTPTFKYIAFGDVGTRIYKGEGTINFTCYDPIAYSLNGNYLEDYDWANIDEWAVASGMLDSKDKFERGHKIENYYDTPKLEDGHYIIHAYNAGNIPTPFQMYITWIGDNTTLTIENETTGKSITLKRTATTADNILIDTERSVALEMKNGEETKVVLNQLVETGRFFTLKQGLNELKVTGGIVTGFEFRHRYL